MIKKIFIGLFGLLAFTPFVFADYINYNAVYEFDVGQPTQVGNYIYQFDSYGNLSTDNGILAGNFVFTQNNAYNVTYTYGFGWINGQLYGYGNSSYGNGNTRQGFINNFCQSDNIIACLEGDFSYDLDFVINNIGSIQNVYFTLNPTAGNFPVALCFYDGVYYYCSEFDVSNGGASSPINSLGLSLNTFQDFVSYNWGSSPFKGGPIQDGYDIGENFYTNGQIVEGYEYLGLDIGYCYGGFPIDDIFEPNQTIEDFTGYQFGIGATVWDLYDLYSGAYSTPKQFFQQMLQAYTNGQINRFKTEPKALIMFVQQYVSGRDRGRLNVGFYDLWDYCNLKFDNVDLNAQYTGHNQTPINGYNQKKVSDSNIGGFQLTGNNAFNTIVGTGFSGNISASEFFGNLTSRFQNGLGTVNTNYAGMIPTYILMFMFALIFIRLISH